MSDTNPTSPPTDTATATPPPVASEEPPVQAAVSKKCIVCGYEGPEPICPKDQMLMEEKCLKCNRCKSDCVCELNDAK